jgi:hypothetical protein
MLSTKEALLAELEARKKLLVDAAKVSFYECVSLSSIRYLRRMFCVIFAAKDITP